MSIPGPTVTAARSILPRRRRARLRRPKSRAERSSPRGAHLP
uniref:Uncharacterized protein n=1 Tax=Arundo donax TaxID=35708 RepID=A0A0A9H264_ARUDO